eukprot:TRINITY_DN544_c0_g1_i1.p1 TRINITY_DN544_c0_g1~~TRINITY_DN544_c0_g1_i1.p1  ORF type:complete len:548 (-),score=113.00 TRINITY_DN544_c0_g1_i1:356-1999(-)
MSSGLSIRGERTTGQDVRTQNVMACRALANVVKSSLGPLGLDKMLVDQVGDVTITNDGATILKNLEVEHPAAKVLVELSSLQDQEVGDGTTSVVILAAEILALCDELVKKNVHPTSIISGLNLAKKEACKFVAEYMSIKTDSLGKDCIINAAKTSMSSKIIGAESEFFAKMVVDAVSAVKVLNEQKQPRYPIKAISILKAHGQSAKESLLVNGFALNCTKAAQGMPSLIKKAQIALLDIDLRKTKMPLGVHVTITDPEKLEAIRQREGDITKERIEKLIKAGANVILTTKGIDDFALKYFVENKVIAVRRCKKSDLKHLAKATGGSVLITLADSDNSESVDSKSFGVCDTVEEVKVGDGELLFFQGCQSSKSQTIILRGANDFMLDEVERSVHDAICVVKRVLESKMVVPGGGAVEAALSVFMEHLAATMGSREQLAIAAFAQAMLVIPKTLAVNAALDATDLVAKLRSYHNSAQTSDSKADYKYTGLDLEHGKTRDNLKAGVLEPAMSKIKMIRFATEAAVTILRIDDSIKIASKDNPKAPVSDNY